MNHGFISGSLRIIVYLIGWAIATAVVILTFTYRQWGLMIIAAIVWSVLFYFLYQLYRCNVKKVTFLLDAVSNADYSFKYATDNVSSDDQLVNESLNRITKILFQARKDAQDREKYYEQIINSVNTGIIVVDERGNVYQTNREALHLLGVSLLTHISQLLRVDEKLQQLIHDIQPGEKHQISFHNERDTIHLLVRASSTKLKNINVRIIAFNDINRELDENELDSWIRLTRVLTHEIMNSITPITSLSETLLMKVDDNKEIRNGLEVIRTTGNGLIDFVENYRKFTHIPTPVPSLFFVNKFIQRMKQLTEHQMPAPNISITIDIQPVDLIVYADENLITLVVLNLLKNAIQAIGTKQLDGKVQIKAYCNKEESVFIEVSNNGPLIIGEELKQIFIPFFTTKSNGSGIGLSISKQIMRLSGGTLSVKSDAEKHLTTFSLIFL